MSSTPSSASCVNATAVENAFSTPTARGTAVGGGWTKYSTVSPAPARLSQIQRAQSTPPEITHHNQYGILTRTAAGHLADVSGLERSWQKLNLSKTRSQYYSEAFSIRGPNNSAKDRVAKDSVILANVKLNCCLESEKDFLIDLSFRLSEIYQRPASCIMVMVCTETSMILGGSREPAYHLTITALPSEIAATKNKRSTHLVQEFMRENLQISPRRGVIRFEPVLEENMATNGMTALEEIEELERQDNEEDELLRAVSRQSRRRDKTAGIPTFAERARTALSMRTATPSRGFAGAGDCDDSKSMRTSGGGRKCMKRRKSILTFFKKN